MSELPRGHSGPRKLELKGSEGAGKFLQELRVCVM